MRITIYSKENCPFCAKAKRRIEELEAFCVGDFDVRIFQRQINCTKEMLDKLSKQTGKTLTTYPQIFVDDEHIGGFAEFDAYTRDLATRHVLIFK